MRPICARTHSLRAADRGPDVPYRLPNPRFDAPSITTTASGDGSGDWQRRLAAGTGSGDGRSRLAMFVAWRPARGSWRAEPARAVVAVVGVKEAAWNHAVAKAERAAMMLP